MKNSDTIGTRTRDLPACRAVPQPTAPPAACPQNLIKVVCNERKMSAVTEEHYNGLTLKHNTLDIAHQA
jgi:hypothetical protein